MPHYREISDAQATRIAEAALERAFSQRVSISAVEHLSEEDRRNLILRARATISGETCAIIIKASRSVDYDAPAPDASKISGLVKESVARALIRELEGVGVGPSTLLAADAESGLIVFGDLGADLGSMVTPLLEGTSAQAEAALTAYAITLGQLHARTLGRTARHAKILGATLPQARLPRHMGVDWLSPVPGLPAGVRLPADELAEVHSRLIDPGPWLGLVHGDGCPDNVLLSHDRAWLIDFEFSAPGHVLLDAVYWRIGFPTCWCAGSIPEHIADRIEAAYRRELAGAFLKTTDGRAFSHEMAIATVARLVNSMHGLKAAMAEEQTWGIASTRSRILWYLQATIDACERAGQFPKVSRVAAELLETLNTQWTGTKPLALYPAFREHNRFGNLRVA